MTLLLKCMKKMKLRLCLVRLNVSGIPYNRITKKKWKINAK